MSATTVTKWIVLVYGQYGVTHRGYDALAPKVLEIEAETLSDVWDQLRAGKLTGGDHLDEIRLDSFKPSLDQSGPESRPDRVSPSDTSMDAKVRVFRADEVQFPFMSEYIDARMVREAEEQKKAEEAKQLAAMQAIAGRLGYQCVKV